jgi:hypothetical protein
LRRQSQAATLHFDIARYTPQSVEKTGISDTLGPSWYAMI